MPKQIKDVLDNDELKCLGRAVLLFHPLTYEELKPKLVRPVASLVNFIQLPALFNRFCEIKGVQPDNIAGEFKGTEACEVKRLFIAVMLSMYNPALFTGIHTNKIKDRLASEIAATIKIKREWVSEQAADLRTLLNPYLNRAAFQDLKDEVKRISDILESEFK